MKNTIAHIGLAVAVLSILAVSPFVELAHQFPKIMVLALGVLLLTFGTKGRDSMPALFWPILVLLGWHGLTTLLSVDWQMGVVGVYENANQGLVVLTTLYLLYSGASRLDAKKTVSAAVIVAVLVLSYHAIYQALFLSHLLPLGRATGLIGSPVYLAAVLAVAFPLLLESHEETKNPWPVILAGIALVLTKSKGGVLAAAAGVFVYGALRGEWSWRYGWFGLPVPPVLVWWLSRETERIELWKASLRAALENPMFGWGPGTFLLALRKHRGEDYIAFMGSSLKGQADAHNDIFQVLVTTGLIGLIIYVWLWYSAAKAVRDEIESPIVGEQKNGALVAAVLVVAFIQAKINPMPIPALVIIALVMARIAPSLRDGRGWLRVPLALSCAFAALRMLQADAHYLKARRVAEPRKSIRHYHAAIKSNPLEITYRLRLQDALVKTGLKSGEKKYLELAERFGVGLAKSRPNHPSAVEAAGDACLASANLMDAFLWLSKAQKLDPLSLDYYATRTAIGMAVNPLSKTLETLVNHRDQLTRLEEGLTQ